MTRTAQRVLGVYAHPDDETFCSGGTFARYAAEGSEIMLVSATRGDAGQIRSASLATRRTLGQVREAELRLAGERLGVAHVECWNYADGTLCSVDRLELEHRITGVIRSFEPDIVFTFGDDGAYGHPDHIAIGQATTAACVHATELPVALYHAAFPRRRMLLLDRLVQWLVQEGPDFRGDPEFVHGLLLLVEEASTLHCVEDHFDIQWFPSGFYIVEQGEAATSLFLLLSGHADVMREGPDGDVRFVTRLVPGQFFGEVGIATARPRNANVVAADSATCLVFSPSQPSLFEPRGEPTSTPLVRGSESALDSAGSLLAEAACESVTCIDVSAYVDAKLQALAAYRTQFPLRPDMLPITLFTDLFGQEYFTRVTAPLRV